MARLIPLVSQLKPGSPAGARAAGGRSFTVGSSFRTDLTDPHSSLPRHTLLTRSGAGFTLHLPAGTAATFNCGPSRLTLEEMLLWGLATKGKAGFTVPLRPGVTAAFSLGGSDFSVAFGEAPALAAPSPIALPAPSGTVPRALRFTRPGKDDILYLGTMTGLMVTALIALLWLRTVPIPTGIMTLEKMPTRISKLLFDAPAKPKPVPVPTVADKGGEGKVAEKPAEKPGEPLKTPTPPAEGRPGPKVQASAEERTAARSKVANMGVLGVLSGKGTAGRSGRRTSSVTALQMDESLAQDLDRVLSEVSGITVGGGGTGEGTGLAGGEGGGAGLIGIETKVAGARAAPVQVARLGTIGGRPVAASGSAKALEPEQREERSARAIARVVENHQGGIRYAYNKELRKNPALKGKVVLRFTIAAEGNVTDCRLEESNMNWPPLEEALTQMALKWRFPPIPEGTVTVAYPFIFFPSM